MKSSGTDAGYRLRQIFPASRVKDRLIDRISWASDAGFYQLIPEAVIFPANEGEIIRLLQWCQQHSKPLVFRAGGSSLSGQSITNGILCVISQHWKGCLPEDEGSLVRVQPGITGAAVNARLKAFRRKIGPDPSSISAAMMGGILSNNASGMCCGVQHNSYHTTRFIRFILADGNCFSTEIPGDYKRFELEASTLASTLIRLRNHIFQNPALLEKIRKRYLSKNTVGYSLNALVDFVHPLDIFAHLLIGAEGTLAFIAEAVMETIPELPHRACGLLFFPDVQLACDATSLLNEAGALMVELMDRASLRAVENKPGMPDFLKNLGPEACALLVEFQSENESQLQGSLNKFTEGSAKLGLLNPAAFTSDEAQIALLWKVRKGLFPAVGAVRQSGSTVILEDLAFPLQVLGQAVLELRQLFQKFAYHDAIIFGHARDGNIHFVVSQLLDEATEIQRYASFMEEVVAMVMRYEGSLKAEHGTGRNMAPFVKTEWGPEAYAIMQELKAAADPAGILNPGVILNTDPKAHLRNLKPLPEVEEEVDKCIECGYCEHVCPSRELSSSPRRRIVIRRAITSLEKGGHYRDADELKKDQGKEVMDTCAVDGLCSLACPVDINTGDLVKRLRKENNSWLASKAAMEAARYFSSASNAAGWMLDAGRLSGSFGHVLSKNLRAVAPALPLLPRWSPPSFQRENRIHPPTNDAAFLYFPSCINRQLGGMSKNGSSSSNVMDALLTICTKTGLKVKEMSPVEDICCSQVFSSKGFTGAAVFMAEKWMEQIWVASNQGLLPVICDVSSCTWTIRNLRPLLGPGLQANYDQLILIDMVEFLHDHVLPLLPEVNKKDKIWLHPVCALQKMGTSEKLLRIGKHFAREVAEPLQGGCCGMAGDRGFFEPELPASAISAAGTHPPENEKIFSCTATCEMALANHFGMEVSSILKLIEESLQN